MPQETKSHVDHGTRDRFGQGMRVTADDPALLARAIEMAVNYRGDVTITLASTGRDRVGYIFDHRPDEDFSRAVLRFIPQDSDERIAIAYDDIASIDFSGRDTAAGRSFETWMKKYVRQKLAGEAAGIEPESLDDDPDA